MSTPFRTCNHIHIYILYTRTLYAHYMSHIHMHASKRVGYYDEITHAHVDTWKLSAFVTWTILDTYIHG